MTDTGEDDEVIVGPWLAFMLAGISWGSLILYRMVKACFLTRGRSLPSLPTSISHLLLIMGLNFLILAILQIDDAFWPFVYALLGFFGVWFLRDIYNMYTISKLDIDEFGHISTTKKNGTVDAEEEEHPTKLRRRQSSIKQVVGFVYPRYLFSREFRRSMAYKFKGGGHNEQISGCPYILEAEDIYADFDSDFTRILLLGLSQIALLGMYVYGVLIRSEPTFNKERYGYYYGGVFIQGAYIIGNNKLQAQFDNFAFWVNTFRGARLNAIYDDSVPVPSIPLDSNLQQELLKPGGRKRKYSKRQSLLKKNDDYYNDGKEVDDAENEEKEDGNVNLAKIRIQLWMRFLLSSAINSCGLIIIMILFPLQLSWSGDPTEFVLNAIAAFFIIELDDLGTPVVYKLITNDAIKLLESDNCTERGLHDKEQQQQQRTGLGGGHDGKSFLDDTPVEEKLNTTPTMIEQDEGTFCKTNPATERSVSITSMTA